jgi:hypothetical protein
VARRVARAAALPLALAAAQGCGPTGPTEMLGSAPVHVSPTAGSQLTTDTPTFTVRNAAGYDLGQAQYTFEIVTQGRGARVAEATTPATQTTTSVTFAAPLPRGMNLAWRVVARNATASVSSAATPFRTPAITCLGTRDGYAHRVIDARLPFCPRSPNIYDDTEEVLGPPDTVEVGAGRYTGFVSLGDRGYVTVDMEACAQDASGPDVRVFQAVGAEPVSLYAGGTPTGPWVLVEARKPCDVRHPGGGGIIKFCDFDLAAAEVALARYFRVEDGEHGACADAGTDSEGADIDAVQILSFGAATLR